MKDMTLWKFTMTSLICLSLYLNGIFYRGEERGFSPDHRLLAQLAEKDTEEGSDQGLKGQETHREIYSGEGEERKVNKTEKAGKSKSGGEPFIPSRVDWKDSFITAPQHRYVSSA